MINKFTISFLSLFFISNYALACGSVEAANNAQMISVMPSQQSPMQQLQARVSAGPDGSWSLSQLDGTLLDQNQMPQGQVDGVLLFKSAAGISRHEFYWNSRAYYGYDYRGNGRTRIDIPYHTLHAFASSEHLNLQNQIR